MPAARDDVVATLVAEASGAEDLNAVWPRILEVLRSAWRAERAVVVHEQGGATALVAAVPAGGKAKAFDPKVLADVLGADDAVAGRQAGLLALGVRPAGDGRWGVGLVRARTPWTAAERRSLGELRPHLELLVERAALRAEVLRARAREGQAAAEHERFLNVISHELRNPLAPILMWTSTLRRLRPNDPDVQRAGQAIANAVNMERRLIEELLDLSRLERGTLELVIEPVDLRDVARAIVDERRAAATEAELTVDCALPASGVTVAADRGRLDQIVRALLENAIKFTPAGGRVRVDVARRTGHGQLTVADTGTGIPAEVVPQLFTPFVKGRNARGGLGLGLALARLLVGLQHGTIDATNPSGGGAHVVVSLPLVRAA
ncbi:MAG TPA: HAMP domain-containing sensor histidine kinase [Candidatus Binatia bacterium]|nr:HAMP domain-containing sensor histidine kinase [Candidatus Binatia bacterium]